MTPNATTCTSYLTQEYSGSPSFQSQQVTINGINFDKESGQGNAMSNIWNWVAYSTLRGTNCISFDFTLHSINPGAMYPNPPPVFNMQAESAVFTNIVSSLTFLSP